MKKSLLFVCVVTAFFGYFFFSVKERSPTEDLISDEKNQAVEGNAEAEKRRALGFDPGEIMTFFFDASAPNWFESYQNFSNPKNGLKNVLDLFWAPDFAISDDGLITGYPVFLRGHDPPKDWCREIRDDPVLSVFAMKDCSGIFSFHFPPAEEVQKNEIEYVTKVVAFLEQGYAAPFFDIWSLDIHYAWEGVSGACWMLGRYIIHWGLIYSTFVLWFLGILLFLFPLFLANFKSLPLALLAILHITIAFVWMRGMMGLFGVRESVHTLIGYAPLFICGPSFLLYVYQGKEKYKNVITTTAFLAVLGFATLFTFEVTHIRELAISAIFGILAMYVLALFSFSRYVDAYKKGAAERITWYDQCIEQSARMLKKTALWIIDSGYARHITYTLLCFFGMASFLLAAGYISTETNPQDYISGYSVDSTMNRLREPAGPGQYQAYAILESAYGLSITDPLFLTPAIGWLNDFERKFTTSLPSRVRTVATVLKAIEEVACGERFCSEKKEDEAPYGLIGHFPETEGDMTLFIMPLLASPNRLGRFRQYFWYDNGFRVIIGIAAHTDAELKTVLDEIRGFNKGYSNLTIILYGKDVLFAEIGSYLTWGNITNKFTSNCLVAFFVALLVWFWQRKTQKIIVPVRCGFAACAPFLFSLSVFLFVLFISGKPLDAVSSSISALAISAAGDFQIYFLRSFVRNCEIMPWRSAIEKTFDEEGAIIVKDAITNAAGFLMLMFAYFKPVRELGFVMCLSMFLCLLGTLVIMASLLSLAVCKPEHMAEEYTFTKAKAVA